MTLTPSFSDGFRPQSDLAVIVACDGNYLPYAATPALAMAARPRREYDVLIGGPEPVEIPTALRQLGIAHVAARNEALLDALPLDARRSLATYMELFLGEALRGIYRRILVIDADILYERGDPARLLRADMLDRAVAAVRDNRQWRTPGRKVREFRMLNEAAHPYFNAGVVMIDTERFAAQDLPARAGDFARNHLAGLGRDQALMNGMLKGDWAEISPLWNWQFTAASAHLTSMADPCLIHFIGTRKPWLASSQGVVPMRMRRAFGTVLTQYFPDTAPVPEALRRQWPSAGSLRAALFRQWRAAGAMMRYLNRFPDTYTMVDPRA
ncbi:Lipopolysaccharide biosynthesis protein, LPS:glycosyltransferase [Paracoccus halophilus]|uniref:Lipopolysaccharide biosynthesis protein, LPS:glycosyltransferase n=1 Tax=Paracoccus halophilus TaxID=376733 RepID=A0A1I0TVM4_9RHOB|nr:glycosyltransferase [Paracoccus halophilus]SFA55690.1 Lipopolysaccharide biosynthesis protein, LPS:glycosyltransferase [Paracoccus halophilus]